jgi:hypothetical protein
MTPQARRRASLRLPDEVAEFKPINGASPLAGRPPERTCGHCSWSEEGKRPDSFKCRRWPPVVHQARPGEALFPIVEADDWCGEFSQ